ncbi:ATP-dependent DNA ligase [Uliginosibacterium gangwonense]|uniref:ATP-dependent DNA ligase n=1 Tax=Uliginosibacterium gangwonense TaxID=392736 RepID=UPI0003653C0F|nr:ATP-dependent DNA ligase [Uliginosibacterium gangwonense]
MNSNFKPILASPADLKNLSWPLLASAKLDGIRAIVIDGVVLSRKLKPIPNLHVQKLFAKYEHFDGELIVGDPTSKSCFRDTTSGVMSVDGEPDVKFYVFDHIAESNAPYSKRIKRVKASSTAKHIVRVAQHLVQDLDQLLALERQHLDAGYEGLILRDPEGCYKHGRSTAREGILLKLKRFEDSEAEVIGLVEQMHNGNEATTDNLGRTKRSSHKANKTGKGTLGALQVRWGEIEFEIGTGLDDELRQKIWDNQNHYMGKLVKFKYFPVGVKEKPRHPVFLGFRDAKDM